MGKYTDFLRYIRHVYKNKHWTAVAMNSKLCEKHRIEKMKEYHTHLYTFKDDEVLAKATTQEMKLLLERASNSMQKLANQQNLEIQQLIFWLETGLVHHNELNRRLK